MSPAARIAAVAVRVGATSATIRDPAALRAALLDPAAATPGPIEAGPRPEAVPAGTWRRMSRLSRLVAEVALEVLDRAGAAPGPRAALFTAWGTAFGEMTTTDSLLARMVREGPDKVSPAAFQTSLFGTPLAHLSLILGLTGPSETVSAGGASAAAAVLRGIDVLASGRAPAALVLAGDEIADMVRTAWALRPGPAPALGEVVAGALLLPDVPATAHLPRITVAPGIHPAPPTFTRTRPLPAEGPLPEVPGAVPTDPVLGSCPAAGLAPIAAAALGGGTVVELDGPRAWSVRVGG